MKPRPQRVSSVCVSGLSHRRLRAHAPLQVSTPGLILPARSPALDNLRVLAAGCRACSTKGHVADVLRARGTKDIDVRAAGFTVRFELEPQSTAAKAPRPPSPSGSTGEEGGGLMRGEDELPGWGEVKREEEEEEETAGEASVTAERPAGASKGGARASPRPCLELAVGCCVYQKGRYLLGHAEGAGSTTAPPRNPAGLPSRVPPPPPSLPLSPIPLPPVREEHSGKELEGGIDAEGREGLGDSPEERTGKGGSPAVQPPSAKTVTPPQRTPESASKPVRGRVQQTTHEAGAMLWGGGPGPRPCREALTIVQSLRVPLSDPHYFRIADLSMYLGVTGAEEEGEVGDEALVQRTQVLGGQDNADEGWTGELLVTRCAVVGNPRQPGTRADAMLSRIRVEVRLCRTLCAKSCLKKPVVARTTASFGVRTPVRVLSGAVYPVLDGICHGTGRNEGLQGCCRP